MGCRGFGTRLVWHVSILAVVALLTVAATTARAQTPVAIPDDVAAVGIDAPASLPVMKVA